MLLLSFFSLFIQPSSLAGAILDPFPHALLEPTDLNYQTELYCLGINKSPNLK